MCSLKVSLKEEDDRRQNKCTIPFHEVVLPRPVAPSPVVKKKVISFFFVLLRLRGKRIDEVKFET